MNDKLKISKMSQSLASENVSLSQTNSVALEMAMLDHFDPDYKIV